MVYIARLSIFSSFHLHDLLPTNTVFFLTVHNAAFDQGVHFFTSSADFRYTNR